MTSAEPEINEWVNQAGHRLLNCCERVIYSRDGVGRCIRFEAFSAWKFVWVTSVTLLPHTSTAMNWLPCE